MPAKPHWIDRIPSVIKALEELPRPFVDRATLEFLLGVGRRRAQQLLAPCVTDRVGTNGLAERNAVIARLRQLGSAPEAQWEMRRRERIGRIVDQLRQERIDNPAVMVEAPIRVMTQSVAGLPAGVRLEPGRITVEFGAPQEALEKLLALAMAIGNDFEAFEKSTGAA